MAINTMSPNYCCSKGEQIALNVDGTTYDETNTYSAYVYCSSVRTLFMLLSVGQCELVVTHHQCDVLGNILYEKIDTTSCQMSSYNQVLDC